MTEIPCDSVDWPGQDGYYRAGRPVEGRFLDHGEGTVTDLATGLMWVRATPAPGVEYDPDGDGKVLWQEALLFCHGLEFAGHDDWRLPNVVELLSIMSLPYVPGNPEHPPLDFTIGGYWTSTPVVDGGGFYVVGRCFGAVWNGPNMPFRVHPVRGGL